MWMKSEDFSCPIIVGGATPLPVGVLDIIVWTCQESKLNRVGQCFNQPKHTLLLVKFVLI